jgi:hypothetical protein
VLAHLCVCAQFLATSRTAASAYLMKRAGATALMVLNAQTDQPIGIITEANITTRSPMERTRTVSGSMN